MITGKSHHRRPDPLLLLAAAVLLGAVMTAAATAGELFNSSPVSGTLYRPQLTDGGFVVASMGQNGGGLSVSLTPPYQPARDFTNEQAAIQQPETLSQFFLLLRYPW